jgi:hypothetical protein
MRLEEQVCSLELAKRLKELGVKQESIYTWGELSHNPYNIDIEIPKDKRTVELFSSDYKGFGEGATRFASAFTVAELGEMLPDSITVKGELYFLKIEKSDDEIPYWWVMYAYNGLIINHATVEDKNEADARAKLLVYLLEKKFIERNV